MGHVHILSYINVGIDTTVDINNTIPHHISKILIEGYIVQWIASMNIGNSSVVFVALFINWSIAASF